MARFYGVVGYAKTVETAPSVYEEQIIERSYYGDVNRNNRKLQNSGQVNDNVNISNEISIIADPFANENIYAMRYVEFMGVKWKITDVDVQFPRLVLSIGGEYNGQQT